MNCTSPLNVFIICIATKKTFIIAVPCDLQLYNGKKVALETFYKSRHRVDLDTILILILSMINT